MKRKSIFTVMIQGVLIGLMVLGMFLSVKAQDPIFLKYSEVITKLKNTFQTRTIDFRGGKIVVSGKVREVDVSGGNDGCYTLTVNVYKLSPNGEKILVRTRSRKVCALIDTPKMVFEDIPRSKVIIEVEIDKPRWDEEKFKVDMNVAFQEERLNP